MNNLDNYRTYGVEVEFISPLSQRELVEEINRNSRNHNSQSLADLQFDMPIVCISSYSNDDSSIWRIKTDGSVSGRGHGLELVTPVLKGEMDMLRLRKILTWLEEIGCTVNRTCGLHVHVGVSDWQVSQFKNLAKRYMKFETAIDTFMPRSRRSSQNSYCQSNAKYLANEIRYRSQFDTCDLAGMFTKINKARTAKDVSTAIQPRGHSGRYVKLNLHSFWTHGTVEFRHHSGTICGDKIDNWVRVCLAMTHLADSKRSIKAKSGDQIDTYQDKLSVFFNGLSKGCDLITTDIRRFYNKRRKALCTN